MRLDVGLCPVEVDIFLGAYDGPRWEIAPFRHRAGWLIVSEARMMMPFAVHSRFLVAAVSDHGETYPPGIAARILDIPTSLPRDAECDPPEELEDAMDALYWDFLGTTDLKNLHYLQDAEAQATVKIHAFEAECAALEAKIWARVRALRAERRRDGLDDGQRAEIDARLNRLLAMPDELARGLRRRALEMRQETEAIEEAVMSSLTDYGELERCYVVRWRARSEVSRKGDIFLPLANGEYFGVMRGQAGIERRSLEQIAEMRVFRNDQAWD